MAPKITDGQDLTTTEEELMVILWEIGSGSIKEIMEKLPADRDLAYTSVSTIIRILEKKNIVASQKVGRGHVYSPLLLKEQYAKSSVNHLMNKVFDGTPVSLVKFLIQDEKLSKQDIAELSNILKEKK